MAVLLTSRSLLPVADSQLPQAQPICDGIVKAAVWGTALIAGSNLAVWLFPSLREIADTTGLMVMRVNTCVALLLAALSLLMWHLAKKPDAGKGYRQVAAGLGAVVMLIGGLTSLEYLTGVNLGIDNLLGPATFAEDHGNAYVTSPGRMSMNACLALFFLGLSLWGLDWTLAFGRARRIFTAPIFAVTSAMPAAFGLVGYMSGSGKFTGLLKSTNILMHAAFILVLLALGVLAIRNDRQPVRRVLSKSAGGILLRWMLPGSTASLVILAWLVGRGRVSGMVAPGEGRALMLFGGLLLFYTLIVAVSRAVEQQEAKARRANSALREEEQRSESILKTSLDGVLIMDESGRVVDWNLAAEKIFGWSREEMLGRLLAEYIIPERLREAHTQGLEKFIRHGPGSALGQRMELPALRRDGSEFPVELSVNAVKDASPPVFVGFIRDITARQKAEQALREAKDQAEKASQAKDDFLAALSHELRTPLTPVLLSSSVLSKDQRLPEDVRHALEMMERHVSLEARLIDDLLDLTRISRGKLLLRTETCDVHSLIQHAWEIIQDDAQNKKLNVQIMLESPHFLLQGDSSRIQQVFWNLLKNAVKFTPAGGSITLTSLYQENASQLVVRVQDNGIGFESGIAEQLFIPFEQEKMEVQFGGLGLGLAIARAIVELHGGSISAASDGPGKGALFTVRLPCSHIPAERVPPHSQKTEDEAATQHLYNILLVEDHEPTRQVLARLLNRAGHEVTAVGSVAEGLLAAERAGHALDILISDVGLPDGSGMDLMQQLHSRGIVLRGIALSGYGMEEDQQRTREAGFTRHLVKPVKFDQLQQALAAGVTHENPPFKIPK